MAYHPGTEAFYIPLNLSRETGTFTDVKHEEGGGGNGQGRRKNRRHPERSDGIGEFPALNARTGARSSGRSRTEAQPNTAALTTAGGLVVVGDWDRNLFVYDVTTGKTLYRTRLSTSAQGFRSPTPSAAGSSSRCPSARAAVSGSRRSRPTRCPTDNRRRPATRCSSSRCHADRLVDWNPD